MAEIDQYLDVVAAIDAAIRDQVADDSIRQTDDADLRRDMHETLYKQTVARRDTVDDLVDQDVAYTRGRADTTDGGGGFWEAIGTGYDPVEDVDTITDRFGLDHITAGGILYRRLDSILTPEMWGAANRSASDTDQAAIIQKMFNLACNTAWAYKGHSLYFPPGEYRCESTIEAYVESGGNTLPPRINVVMDGVIFVPAASRITALQLGLMGRPFFDAATTGDGLMISPGRPILRLSVRKGRTTGDDTPVWATDGSYPASFSSAFPYETASPWTTNDATRAEFIQESDCGVEIIMASGPAWDVEVEKAEWFAVGVRLRSDDAITASGPVANFNLTVRQVRSAKVACMLCTKTTGAGTGHWCNANHVNLMANRNSSSERVSGKPLYGIMLTKHGTNASRPNGNVFDYGMHQGWTWTNSGTTESAMVLLDCGAGNVFRDSRHEDGSASARHVIMPNPDVLNRNNRFRFHSFGAANTPIHNQRANPIELLGPIDPVGAGTITEGLREVAAFRAEDCIYSASDRIYLPRPWLWNIYTGVATWTNWRPYAMSDGGFGQDAYLALDANGQTAFFHDANGRQRLGVMLKIAAIAPWNRIRVLSDAAARVRMHAFDSSRTIISAASTPFARLHGTTDMTGDANGHYFPGDLACADFSLVSTASIAYLFVSSDCNSASQKWIKILTEGIHCSVVDLHPTRTVLPSYPKAHYATLGSQFSVRGFGEYVCSTAGWITNGAWATGVSVTKNEYRINAGKIYRAATAAAWPATTGSTAPTHTSGTVTDGLVGWEYIAAGTEAVTKKTESRDLVAIFKAIDGTLTNGDFLAGLTPRAGTLQNVRVRLGTPPDAATTLSVMLSRIPSAESDLDDLLTASVDFDDGDAPGTVKNGTVDSAVTIAAGDTFAVELTGDHENAADLVVSAELVTHVET